MIHESHCKTIGIFPASGGLGGSTYTHLLRKVPSTRVTLISRHPEKVPEEYKENGVTTRQASYESTSEELSAAFTGIDVLFLISYPSHVHDYRVQVHAVAVEAAHAAGVKHIIYSSLAFALPDKSQSMAEVMQAHLATEKQLLQIQSSDSDFSWTSIREGLYHESFPIYTSFWTLENPSDEIIIPHDGSGPGISWAKRDELGEATANLIKQYATSTEDFLDKYRNKIVVLTGPKEWTLAETVKSLSKAVGGDVQIRKVSVDEWVKQEKIMEYFKNEQLARTWATAWEAIKAGEAAYVSPTLGELLGRDPEEFDVTIRTMVKETGR